MEEGGCLIPVICVCQGNYLIWDAKDAIELRKRHRIIGVCTGSLPWKPRQNSQGGLPLRLSKVEAAFLVGRRLARLIDSNEIPLDVFNIDRKNDIENLRAAQRNIQTKLLLEQKSIELDAMSASILQGKKAKRRKVERDETSDISTTEKSTSADFKEIELRKTSSLKLEQTWIKMDVGTKFTERFPVLQNYDFDFSEHELLKLSVFSDLNDQGYYITNGNKFGGDFLVYPGDPIAYHSFYIAICVSHNKQLSGQEYATYGRLASTVRKTLILCSKAEDGEIKYLSMSWTGIVPQEGPYSPSSSKA